LYISLNDKTALGVMQDWLEFIATNRFGPLLLLCVYIVNPLIPVPITILTVFSGYVFGAVWGTLYGLFAALVASSIGYAIGRFFTGKAIAKAPLIARLQQRGFETVIACRLPFISGDLVNYAAGAARISFPFFLLATALGGLPSLVVAVLAGASIEGQFYFTALRFNGWFIALSLLLLLVSLLLTWYLRKTESKNFNATETRMLIPVTVEHAESFEAQTRIRN
jgi:uncharacterized membrane protein YdjX (TVP38/TMEM64 family)